MGLRQRTIGQWRRVPSFLPVAAPSAFHTELVIRARRTYIFVKSKPPRSTLNWGISSLPLLEPTCQILTFGRFLSRLMNRDPDELGEQDVPFLPGQSIGHGTSMLDEASFRNYESTFGVSMIACLVRVQ